MSNRGVRLASTTIQVLGTDGPFVTSCAALCLGGQRWYLYGASILGGLEEPTARVRLATAAGLNTVRITNFLDEHGSTTTAAYDSQRWSRVDATLAAARSAGLHVVLDLSTYRNLLWNAGTNPCVHDWGTFISFATSTSRPL